MTSQTYETYVPVYDAIPEGKDEQRQFLTEALRKISDNLNVREIGYYLQEELLSGSQIYPSASSSGERRSIFRITIDCGALVLGANTIAHGITFDANFTLLKLWVAGTDTVGLIASVITDDHVTMTAANLTITSPRAYNRAIAVIEYIKEA